MITRIEPKILRQADDGSASAAPAEAVADAPAEAVTPAAPRPVDQIHADIVTAQAEHAKHLADAKTNATAATEIQTAEKAVADRLRSLMAELKSAVSSVESVVETDIKEVEGFFERVYKDVAAAI